MLQTLRQAGPLFAGILRHPAPFLKNLVAAGKLGFANFLAHGKQHLLDSVQQWLLGGLARTGLQLPKQLDGPGVVELLLSVFGLTKDAVLDKLRARLATVVGPANARHIETLLTKVGGVAVTLVKHGPAAWKDIVAEAGDLKKKALDMVRDTLLDTAVRAVPIFLAKLVVPAGAF